MPVPVDDDNSDIAWPWCDACQSYHHPDNPTCFLANCHVQEMGYRFTDLGELVYIRVYHRDRKPLSWRTVYEAFAERYPDKWAVQFFPPRRDLVDEDNIYHLFILEGPVRECVWGDTTSGWVPFKLLG